MRKLYKHKCKTCGKEFETTYKESKCCSRNCASILARSIQVQNTENLVFDSKRLWHYEYKCDKCGEIFFSNKPLKKSRKKHCEKCRRKVVHFKENITTIFDFSKRTITKILNRGKLGCMLCGWNKANCDIHHIIPRKKGGTDELTNLIILCPNCHREIHSKVSSFSNDELKKRSLVSLWEKIKELYHPCN